MLGKLRRFRGAGISDAASRNAVLTIIVFGCVLMALVDLVINPSYVIKSLVKIGVFLVIPLAYLGLDTKMSLRAIFCFDLKSFLTAIGFGVCVYAAIVGGYMLIGARLNLSATPGVLGSIGITSKNFIWAALYVSLINSLLEEFTFRGFAFLCLKRVSSRKAAYLFSALMFAAYHVAMMTDWFSVWMILCAVVSLFAAGIMFDYINEKSKNIYASWMVHMFANFAINTIGLRLLGIIII